MKKRFLLVPALLSCGFAFATHNLSGDMAYRWISGYTYEVTVHTFTKVQSPADRCELTVYFGDGDSAIAPRVNGLQTICTAPDHDGVNIASNVRYNVYQVTHVYPGQGIYHVTMTDPNRSSAILNIPNSINTSFRLEAFIYINPLLGANSSAIVDHYTDLDTSYKWVYNSFNGHATDPDGDSLVYELMAPPFAQNYVLPFNNFYFGCDSVTGKVSWDRPDSLGAFAFDIRIVEYRRVNNQYYIVGQSMRDIYADVFMATGVEDALAENDMLSVYPLPSRGEVNITAAPGIIFDGSKVEIMDVSGKKMEVQYTIQQQKIVIEGSLSPGLYIFRIANGRELPVTGRFVIVP